MGHLSKRVFLLLGNLSPFFGISCNTTWDCEFHDKQSVVHMSFGWMMYPSYAERIQTWPSSTAPACSQTSEIRGEFPIITVEFRQMRAQNFWLVPTWLTKGFSMIARNYCRYAAGRRSDISGLTYWKYQVRQFYPIKFPYGWRNYDSYCCWFAYGKKTKKLWLALMCA